MFYYDIKMICHLLLEYFEFQIIKKNILMMCHCKKKKKNPLDYQSTLQSQGPCTRKGFRGQNIVHAQEIPAELPSLQSQ